MIFGLVMLAFLAFWVWGVIDVILADGDRCRNLPKVVWVLIVIFLGFIGAALWFLLGRPERSAVSPPESRRQSPSRPVGLEDRPGWTAAPSTSATSAARSRELDRRLEEWEAEQRRRRETGESESQ